MVEYKMHLKQVPFSMIKNGIKTIELRLYDENRKKITIGDTIRFYNLENENETILTKVVGLCIFDTFSELYKTLPLLKCGYNEENISKASEKDMEKYYSLEEQKQFSVVGICIVVL